jgi:hypothetical protein
MAAPNSPPALQRPPCAPLARIALQKRRDQPPLTGRAYSIVSQSSSQPDYLVPKALQPGQLQVCKARPRAGCCDYRLHYIHQAAGRLARCMALVCGGQRPESPTLQNDLCRPVAALFRVASMQQACDMLVVSPTPRAWLAAAAGAGIK